MVFFLYLLRLIVKYMKKLFSKENILTIFFISIEVENFHSIINPPTPPKKQPKKDALDLSIQSFSSLNSLENCKDIDTKHDKK